MDKMTNLRSIWNFLQEYSHSGKPITFPAQFPFWMIQRENYLITVRGWPGEELHVKIEIYKDAFLEEETGQYTNHFDDPNKLIDWVKQMTTH